MTTVRFVVSATLDLPQRGGILAAGKVYEGTLVTGMLLRNTGTGQDVQVLGVKFPTPTTEEAGRVILVLERSSASALRPGSVLEARRDYS